MKISDYMVQMNEPEFDRDCLQRKLFSVNMRLFETSEYYKNHILGIIEYMKWAMSQRWEDYESNPNGGTFGISCANLGMAYNIIGWRVENSFDFMINPKIKEASKEMVLTQSNCGSLKLKEKIPVMRHKWIFVSYYDIKGKFQYRQIDGKNSGFTIQHEIDHNLGILITDKNVESKDAKQL